MAGVWQSAEVAEMESVDFGAGCPSSRPFAQVLRFEWFKTTRPRWKYCVFEILILQRFV